MTPTEALAQVAAVVTAAAVLPGGCSYPAVASPPPRSGQVEWLGHERADNLNQQVWLLRAGLHVIAPRLNESTYDVGAVDALVLSVCDLFDPSNPAGYHLEIAGDRADCCSPTGSGVQWFQGHYAHRIDLLIKLRRFAGGT